MTALNGTTCLSSVLLCIVAKQYVMFCFQWQKLANMMMIKMRVWHRLAISLRRKVSPDNTQPITNLNSLVGGQFLMYPVTWTTAYCRPSLDGPSVLRWRARTGCDGDAIGSTATSPRRMRIMKPRRDPIHSLILAANDNISDQIRYLPS